MSKDRYNQIIDEAYEDYRNHFLGYDDVPTKDVFVFECKTDKDFSERWGLKIEERELSIDERREISPNSKTSNLFKDLCIDFCSDVNLGCWNDSMPLSEFSEDIQKVIHSSYDDENIPSKLITVAYKNETIVIYE